jgi:hypothetical protein
MTQTPDPLPGGVLPPSERDQDPAREEFERELVTEPARPLTREEREAAEHDPGQPARVYAPEEARVPKPPIPGDDQRVLGGALADEDSPSEDLDSER